MAFHYENNDSHRIGSLTTPPDDEIDLLRISIAEKSTELEAARILLKSFQFPNDILRNAHERTTAQLGLTVHKLRTRMMALLPPKPSTNDPTAQQDGPSVVGSPTRMDDTETEVPYGSPATSPGFSAQATALWHRDYCFATDRSEIDKILRQALEPISFDIDPNDPEDMDPCLDVDCELLATLDPATWSDVCDYTDLI
jgi:hypothetical protein